MKASEIEVLKEDASDHDMIDAASQNIYRKMKAAGLKDRDARHRIATLFRQEADNIESQK